MVTIHVVKNRVHLQPRCTLRQASNLLAWLLCLIASHCKTHLLVQPLSLGDNTLVKYVYVKFAMLVLFRPSVG